MYLVEVRSQNDIRIGLSEGELTLLAALIHQGALGDDLRKIRIAVSSKLDDSPEYLWGEIPHLWDKGDTQN